jgi:hypothetical protein
MRNGEVDSISSTPCRNDVTKTEEEHCDCICPFRTLFTFVKIKPCFLKRIPSYGITYLRPIAQGTNQNQEEKTNVEIKEDLKDKFASTLAQEVERICS